MSPTFKKATAGVAALAALALGGAAVAGAATDSTATSTTGTGSSTTSSQGTRPSFPAPGTAAHEDQEKPVTGETAAKVQAAAVKSVGSGTAGAVTTDFTGKGYETTVTKADGTKVEVHLDSALKVMQGHGGPGGPGGAGHGPGGPGMNGSATPPSGSSSGAAPPAGTSQG